MLTSHFMRLTISAFYFSRRKWIVRNLKDRSVLPASGGFGLCRKGKPIIVADSYLSCDFNACQDLYEAMQYRLDRLLRATDVVKDVHRLSRHDTDERQTAALIAVTATLDSIYQASNVHEKHRAFGEEKGRAFKLSAVRKMGFINNMEKAALATDWLKRLGYDAQLIMGSFYGDGLNSNNLQAMVGLSCPDGMILYDPSRHAKPDVSTSFDVKLPALFFVDKDIWKKFCAQAGKREVWLKCESLYAHESQTFWFGVSAKNPAEKTALFRKPVLSPSSDIGLKAFALGDSRMYRLS